MATVHADPHVASSDHLAHERRLQQCRRALRVHGWEQRLQPLATHMVEKHLVRSRGHAGAPLQQWIRATRDEAERDEAQVRTHAERRGWLARLLRR